MNSGTWLGQQVTNTNAKTGLGQQVTNDKTGLGQQDTNKKLKPVLSASFTRALLHAKILERLTMHGFAGHSKNGFCANECFR